MTEELIDPKAVQQLADFDWPQQPLHDWVERHWFLMLAVTLVALWCGVIYLLSQLKH